uniref:DNA topoisomerase n=1 Tax=Ananas comosus var. bracteatus TaxID=296719 RepID=A0A6V7QTF6_ANACO
MSGERGLMRVLNVAEKPSVAKAHRGRPCLMLFTSVTGHLMELDFDDRFRKWNSCDPTDLYHAPLRKLVPQDKLDIKKTLEEEARKCQWLVLWLDCDREGENIAFEVVEVCTAANRHLDIWRAHFSALTDRDIRESVANLGRPNKLFADAVDARQEIDLRIGASFTRFQTMLLRDAFVLDFAGDERNLVLSYGPCQFPTLGFIVERYWEIQSHEPEEFWTINCSHTSEEGTANFSWMRGHLFDYNCAVVIYEMCVEEPTATVKNVKHHEKLNYPRTETDGFSVNTDLHGIVRDQVGHHVWGSYAQRLLHSEAGLWRNPSNGGHDDKAHPPIHPTKFSAGEPGWSQDHNKLYELVVRHFLACVSQPAVGAETTVEIDIAGEQFNASGRVIIAKNYLDVYRFESWGGTLLPTYTVGQQFLKYFCHAVYPTSLTLDSGVTRPPPLLSEADLLSCMDKAGIGTDATMHDHIKKLLDRCYATKDSNTRFSPTNLGEALVMGYDEMGYELWKPYLRSMMECDMKAVSMGTKRKSEVLENCLQQMKACFLDARVNKVKLLEAMEIFFERSNRPSGDANNFREVVRPCGICNESNMVLKRRPCRNVVWLPGSLSEAAVTSNVCPTCAPGPVYMIQFKFRRVEIPPNYDVDHLGCIGGCDSTLRELTEICGTGSRNQSNATEGSEQQKHQVAFDMGIQGRNLAHIAGNQDIPQTIAPPRFRVHVVFNQPVPKTPETLQVKSCVAHVENHVPYGQRIRKVTEGGDSTPANPKNAASSYGKIIWRMVLREVVASLVEAVTGHHQLEGEGAVGEAGEEDVVMVLHSCQRLLKLSQFHVEHLSHFIRFVHFTASSVTSAEEGGGDAEE